MSSEYVMLQGSAFTILMLTKHFFIRRREKEQQKKTKPKAKAPKKRAPAKKEPPKKRGRTAKQVGSESSDDEEDDEDYNDGVPDTSADAALAASMSGKRVSSRNLDAKGNKFKRAAALAKIREVS